jgi:hypothetical protein
VTRLLRAATGRPKAEGQPPATLVKALGISEFLFSDCFCCLAWPHLNGGGG